MAKRKHPSFTRPGKRPETKSAGRARGHAWTPGRVGGLGHSHWQDTRPSLREPRKGHSPAVRVVNQSPVGSAAEGAQHSRKSTSLPASKSPTRSSPNPGCGMFRPQVHAQPKPCAEAARAVRRSVRERAGCRRSGRWNGAVFGHLAECSLMQNMSRCRKGADILLLSVGSVGFRPPPVGQVQQLQSKSG